MSEPSYAARRTTALAQLAAGDAEAALREFRWTVWYPRVVPPDELVDALGVLGRIFAALGRTELAERAAHASVDPLDPDGLYDLGYHLIEEGLPAIAATVLKRCLEVVPGSEQVVTELCAALERHLAYADARRVLEAHPALVEQRFLCRYLLAYNAAMSGDLATPRKLLPALVPEEPIHEGMAARIAALVARADRVTGATPLDPRDLRGWHYVVTGGLLTHLSPHGRDEGMHGRYAWLQDSIGRVRAGLEHLRAVLAAWGETPACVYAPPGRDHEAVAGAAAALLGVPQAPWPMVGTPAPGLVVVYDLATLSGAEIERLIERKDEQLLYAHAACWTEDFPVAPEIVTVLYQSLVAPWAAQLTIAPAGDGARTQTTAPDPRDAAELADAIAGATVGEGDEEGAPDDDRPALLALAAAVGRPVRGRRERWWAGGPVTSNRFV